MNLFQLKCFLSVAELLSFARAAEQLHITQPTVTHQIQVLEKELNTKLFKRTTRNVFLTEAGESFLGDANQIVRIFEQAKTRFEMHYGQNIPTFSIGCHGHQELRFIPKVLQELKARFPNVHPDIQMVPFAHLYRLLEEEQVDAIFSFQESDQKKAPGKYQELEKTPIVAVCPKEHYLASRAEISYEELSSEKLILNNPRKCPEIIAKYQGRLLQNRLADTIYFSEFPEVAITLVKAGFGLTLLPRNLTPYDSTLALLPVKELAPMSYGIYYKTLDEHPLLSSFMEISIATYSSTPEAFLPAPQSQIF